MTDGESMLIHLDGDEADAVSESSWAGPRHSDESPIDDSHVRPVTKACMPMRRKETKRRERALANADAAITQCPTIATFGPPSSCPPPGWCPPRPPDWPEWWSTASSSTTAAVEVPARLRAQKCIESLKRKSAELKRKLLQSNTNCLNLFEDSKTEEPQLRPVELPPPQPAPAPVVPAPPPPAVPVVFFPPGLPGDFRPIPPPPSEVVLTSMLDSRSTRRSRSRSRSNRSRRQRRRRRRSPTSPSTSSADAHSERTRSPKTCSADALSDRTDSSPAPAYAHSERTLSPAEPPVGHATAEDEAAEPPAEPPTEPSVGHGTAEPPVGHGAAPWSYDEEQGAPLCMFDRYLVQLIRQHWTAGVSQYYPNAPPPLVIVPLASMTTTGNVTPATPNPNAASTSSRSSAPSIWNLLPDGRETSWSQLPTQMTTVKIENPAMPSWSRAMQIGMADDAS